VAIKEYDMTVFTVREQKHYRATITLGLLERWASNEMIASKLCEAGFTDVKVEGSGGTRQAEALWPVADTTAEMPSQVTEVLEV
jgi:hypothetical protein